MTKLSERALLIERTAKRCDLTFAHVPCGVRVNGRTMTEEEAVFWLEGYTLGYAAGLHDEPAEPHS